MEKKGTPASPATARASRVLPVPGGPTRRTPRGMRAPRAMNFSGYLRNSTTSASSSLDSSTPATSMNVTAGLLAVNMRALLLPKLMAWEFDPWAWRIMNRIRPMKIRIGRKLISKPSQLPKALGFCTSIFGSWPAWTPLSVRIETMLAPSSLRDEYSSPLFRVTVKSFPSTLISETLPASESWITALRSRVLLSPLPRPRKMTTMAMIATRIIT